MNPNNAAASAVINILINANTAMSGAAGYNRIMAGMTATARQTAQDSALSWNNIFGANFFADLAANMVRQMVSGFGNLVRESVQAASKVESAFAGLGSTARNLGFDAGDVNQTVRNLDLVQKGLLNVGDAAQATKNLLATGFNIQQSTELIRRFGDTAAFGRQSALSFGYAIASATEGIKNQNSILVDNAGVTKNLSVILRERGFQIQDLSDKVKGAAAREALYQGLLKETAVQQGDANRLLDTTQGQMLRIEAAQQRVLVSLGEWITKSKVAKGVFSGLVTVLDVMANSSGAVLVVAGAITAVTVAVIALNSAQIAALPVINQLISTFGLLGKVMTLNAGLMAGQAATVAAFATGWGAVIAVLLAVGYAIYSYNAAGKEQIKVTNDSIETTKAAREAALDSVKVIDNLKTNNNDLTESTRTQIQLYKALDPEAQKRIDSATTEADKVAKLREEYDRLAASKNAELQATGRTVTQNLLAKVGEYNALQAQINAALKTEKAARDREAEFTGDPSRIVGYRRESDGGNVAIYAGERAGDFANQATAANKAYSDLKEKQAAVTEEAKKLYGQQGLIADSLHLTTGELVTQTFAFNNQATQADAAQNSLLNFAKGQGVATTATVKQTDATQGLIDKLKDLKTLSERSQVIEDAKKAVAEEYGSAGDIKGGVREFNRLVQVNPELARAIQQKKAATAIDQELDKITNVQKERTHKQKTEFESLTESVRKLRGEVASYTNLTSKEFTLRFEREELERTKRDFEHLIDLRRELGLPISTPLPQNAAGARAELEHLEQVKRLRDQVLALANEQRDAEEKLTLARIASTSAVVDAETRAATAYFENIRKRRDAEAQLTADIASQLRRRAELETHQLRDRRQAEAEAYREFLEQRNQEEFDRLKQIARIQALGGDPFRDNPLVAGGQAIATRTPAEASPVVQRLDTGNKLLSEILAAVRASNLAGSETVGGGGGDHNLAFFENLGKAGGLRVSSGFRKNAITSAGRRSYHAIDAARDFTGTPAQMMRFAKELAANYAGELQELIYTPLGFSVKNGRRTNPIAASDHLTHVHVARRGGVAQSAANKPTAPANAVATVTVTQQGDGTPAVHVDLPSRARVNQASAVAQQFFGLPDASNASLSTLSTQSRDAIADYLEAQKQFNANSREQVVAQDKLTQARRVDFEQVRELEVAQARYNRLLGGESRDVLEVLNDAEIARAKAATQTLASLIATNAYLDKLRGGDQSIIAQLITQDDAARAGETAKAFEDIVKARDFLARYAAGDPVIAEHLQKVRESRDLASQKSLTVDVDDLKSQARAGGRNPALEQLQLEKEYYAALVQVGTTEASLERQRALFGSEEYRRATQTNDVLTERASLERDLFQLENERATGDINQALRVRLASEREIADIHRADLKAQEDVARANVRLADMTVLHQDQANARVLDHMASVKSLTDIYADAKIKVVDAFYGGIDRITGKLQQSKNFAISFFGEITNGLLKLGANQLLQRLMFPNGTGGAGGGGTAGGFGGGAGGGALNLGNLLGGFGVGGFGGTPPFVGNFGASGTAGTGGGGGFGGGGGSAGGFGGLGGFLQLLGAGGFGGTEFGVPAINTITSQQAQAERIQSALQKAGLTRPRIVAGGGGIGGGTWAKLFEGIGFGKKAGTGGQLASMLPALGLTLGASAGQGGIGSILGGAGGLLLGAGMTAAPSFLSGTFLAPLFSNPITAVVGAGLLVGGIVLGAVLKRDKLRKAEEQQRTAIFVDSRQQLNDILAKMRSTRTGDYTSFVTQAEQVRADYLAKVGQLTDAKTRRIAQDTVRDLDTIIATIRSEAKTRGQRFDFAAAQENAFAPTFGLGGDVGYVAGMNAPTRAGTDTVLGLFNRRETVITPENIYALGGYDALRRAGVRGAGWSAGNTATQSYEAYAPRATARNYGGAGLGDLPIQVIAVADEQTADVWLSKAKGKTLAQKVRIAVYTGEDGGMVDAIGGKLSGKF